MLVDAHSHVDRYDLVDEQTLGSALTQITQHRILTISNAMDLPSHRRNLEISEMCSLVLSTLGVHPWNAPQYADHLDDLSEVIEQSPMLGEIGLDHYSAQDTSTYPAQRKVLEFFLGAASEQKKITSLHTKGAESEVLELLGVQPWSLPGGLLAASQCLRVLFPQAIRSPPQPSPTAELR